VQEIAACRAPPFANKLTSEGSIGVIPSQTMWVVSSTVHTTAIPPVVYAASRSGKRSEPCNLGPSLDGFTLMRNVA
jgi:hypothetical protein